MGTTKSRPLTIDYYNKLSTLSANFSRTPRVHQRFFALTFGFLEAVLLIHWLRCLQPLLWNDVPSPKLSFGALETNE